LLTLDASCAVHTTSSVGPVPQTVRRIDPLSDRRWDEFVATHPRASVFHSSPWLEALARTYGYQPRAYTTSAADGDLKNALLFCRIESWLTGRRLVSLPFSDHCEPLVDEEKDWSALSLAIEQEFEREHWRYLELRPLGNFGLHTSLKRTLVQYGFHQLNLRPSIEEIFRSFHKNSIQRKIRRAEREGLGYCEGSSEILLNQFYELFVATRKRHMLPPPPREWFVNLVRCFGKALKIRVAYDGSKPVASIITLCHKDTLVYKYGCSNPQFNHLGGMHSLMWRAIREGNAAGLRTLDFGRTDADQQGLITYKSRWGTKQSVLTYLRYGESDTSTHFLDLSMSWKRKAATYLVSHLPPGIVLRMGRAFYGHAG
jgi:CelD/BcsL family acetyltransferase involved in cellulose biosynthesis